MNNALIVSILRGRLRFIVHFICSIHFKNKILSIFTAFLFVISPLYFRFTAYWPFFSDVFIWLPLLLLAMEKSIQQRKSGLLILTITLVLINNFYFAYYF